MCQECFKFWRHSHKNKYKNKNSCPHELDTEDNKQTSKNKGGLQKFVCVKFKVIVL